MRGKPMNKRCSPKHNPNANNQGVTKAWPCLLFTLDPRLDFLQARSWASCGVLTTLLHGSWLVVGFPTTPRRGEWRKPTPRRGSGAVLVWIGALDHAWPMPWRDLGELGVWVRYHEAGILHARRNNHTMAPAKILMPYIRDADFEQAVMLTNSTSTRHCPQLLWRRGVLRHIASTCCGVRSLFPCRMWPTTLDYALTGTRLVGPCGTSRHIIGTRPKQNPESRRRASPLRWLGSDNGCSTSRMMQT
ncbi:hypothetical protein PIB30_022943 [Stylosanthes scabra]|uniref:Uncharacterized protein n=1 Tax=Stylosanthes scabra TaxID=79078 RepID=A0ABU6R9K4_9FABA|nr:hypothetical protein [Stylosanthes scabra]